MNVSLLGYGENTATFEAAAGLAAGNLVKLSANGTVAPAGDGDAFIGVCQNVRGGYAAVQLKGYCTAAYSGSVPLGRQALVSDAAGKAKAAAAGAAGAPVIVVDIDAERSVLGMIL